MNDQTAKADAGSEFWKPICGYEGKYLISNRGRVRTIARQGTNDRILKQRIGRNGYCLVMLLKHGKYKTHLVHRLVAIAFIGNPKSLPCVNHKDEDKQNNRVENLEWCSYQYNNNYGTARKRGSEKRWKPCIGTWADGKTRRFESCTIASRETGISQGNIWGACNGLWKTAGGVIWKYEQSGS